MRINLKMFRISQRLSQEKFAEKIGCSRASYSAVEKGNRNGTNDFWLALQKAFNIPDEEMWGLMKRENE